MRGVKSFQDLPILLIEKEPLLMGYQHKATQEVLDKIIQFVHHYQNLHDGETPSSTAIENEIGKPAVMHYIALLEKANRVERIQPPRPLRLRILTHPCNRAAIRRLEKALAAAEAAAAPPPPAPAEDVIVVDASGEQLPEAAEALSAAVMPELKTRDTDLLGNPALTEERVTTRVTRAPTFAPPTTASPVQTWAEAEKLIARHGGDLHLIASTYIIKTTRDGDLLAELINRGYTISKPMYR